MKNWTIIIPQAVLVLACCLTGTLEAQNLYVADSKDNNLGEYGLDGSTVNASVVPGLSYPVAIAISGNDMFVVNHANGTIGEYTTSGATVNASLISGLNGPVGIAVSGNNLFVVEQTNLLLDIIS